ncbi:hypothetical protein A9W96_27675 [Mycobacterium sp. 1245852.3]|nr:hypothetical protein A9W96_27675 [Mycobacterium sp. 1245852.3]
MYELATTVYLNQARRQGLGFGHFEPAKLYAAAAFTLTATGGPSHEQTTAALETARMGFDFRRQGAAHARLGVLTQPLAQLRWERGGSCPAIAAMQRIAQPGL